MKKYIKCPKCKGEKHDCDTCQGKGYVINWNGDAEK